MPTTYTDAAGVHRVARIDDLPDESLRCYATGHQWDDPPVTDARGWGGDVNAVELDFQCPCGRRKRMVFDLDTGDYLGQPQYSGGTMLIPDSDFPRRIARAEWARRKRLNARGVSTVGGKRRKARG